MCYSRANKQFVPLLAAGDRVAEDRKGKAKIHPLSVLQFFARDCCPKLPQAATGVYRRNVYAVYTPLRNQVTFAFSPETTAVLSTSRRALARTNFFPAKEKIHFE